MSSSPKSTALTYDGMLGRLNNHIAQLNQQHGIKLKPLGVGTGTDILEESILALAPAIQPRCGGGSTLCLADNRDAPLKAFDVYYHGLSAEKAGTLAVFLRGALDVEYSEISVTRDRQASEMTSRGWGVSLSPRAIERILPHIENQMTAIAKNSELAAHYSEGGSGSAIKPIEHIYTDRLNAALGTSFKPSEGLRNGYMTFGTDDGMPYFDTLKEYDEHRVRVADVLVEARYRAGISRDDVGIFNEGRSGLSFRTSHIDKYGSDRFFEQMLTQRDYVREELRKINPNLVSADDDHGAVRPVATQTALHALKR